MLQIVQFLQTECSMQDWSLSALSFLLTLQGTMHGILQAYGKCGRPIHGILSDTTSAFTDQPRLCYRKHCSLQQHPCFRAMINLQPCICRLRCSSSRATGTPVVPTADSKRNALLSALFCPFLELVRSPFRKNLPLPVRF